MIRQKIQRQHLTLNMSPSLLVYQEIAPFKSGYSISWITQMNLKNGVHSDVFVSSILSGSHVDNVEAQVEETKFTF